MLPARGAGLKQARRSSADYMVNNANTTLLLALLQRHYAGTARSAITRKSRRVVLNPAIYPVCTAMHCHARFAEAARRGTVFATARTPPVCIGVHGTSETTEVTPCCTTRWFSSSSRLLLPRWALAVSR